MSPLKQRAGVLVEKPSTRLSPKQIELIDAASRELLEDPGLLCYNDKVTALFKQAGATVEDGGDAPRVRLNSDIVDQALATAPPVVTLGARDKDNRLVLDAGEPRARFVSGAETNIWLDVEWDGDDPRFVRRNGSIERLCQAAHLADNLEHLDAFIRCVNIRDEAVDEANKDVNKFLASLNNIGKHVMAGLTRLTALDDVCELATIVAGGPAAFAKEPPISFITCVVKSPLQIVDDTADKLLAIAARKVPVVISSSPMGGATAPFDEFGMVAQINAEILAGIAITQLASPGAPIVYGSVPVRTRLDNLNDMYGAPQFNHYNHDCIQMARHYQVPCYSTAGVGDASIPGIQATAEKMLTMCSIPRGGAQYIHYAFGLLERTNVFCPVQAVLDDAHIGIVKWTLAEPAVDEQRKQEVVSMVREVMETPHRTYMYHIPLPTRDSVYACYPLESDNGGALRAADEAYREIMRRPRRQLAAHVQQEILAKIPNVLPQTLTS